MVHAFALLSAFVFAVVLVSGLRPVAVHVGLVDRPDGRKQHEGDIPLVGGLAMFGGFAAVTSVLFPGLHSLAPLFVGSLILIVTGLLDDRWNLSPTARFVAQIAATLVMVYGGDVVVRDLGNLFLLGGVALGAGSILFTVVATVGAVNAMNMTDGVDGLAGTLAMVMVVALATVAWTAGLGTELDLLLTLACAILGFLAFNARTPWQARAKVFMGDAGSMFLGFALAWFLVRLSQGDEPAMAPVTALWIFAVPLLDALRMMARRLARGTSPFRADRAHLHHLLLRAGFSVPHTVLIIAALAALFAVVGVGGKVAGISEGAMFYGFVAFAAVYALTVARLASMTEPRRAQDSAPGA